MAKKLTASDFDLVNKDGQAVLYLTDNPSYNVFTFRIINKTGADLALTGGPPAQGSVSAASANGSTFNFNFETMLTADVVKNMKITLPNDWAKEYREAGVDTPASWSLAPTKDVVLKPDDELKFVLENITTQSSKPGNFEIMYSNIPGFTDSVFPITKHLAVQKPPDPDKKTLPLDHGYDKVVHPIDGQTEGFLDEEAVAVFDDTPVPIFITYDPTALIKNGFTYFLTNTSKDPIGQVSAVPSSPPIEVEDDGAALDADNAPLLYISFLFGDAPYDITTQSLADNNIAIDVAAKETKWTPIKHTASTSYWLFKPDTGVIFAPHETASFDLRTIITELNVDPGTISTMYVQINNVQGYNDANYTLSMQKKVASASAISLNVQPHTIDFGQNVELTWVTSLAKKVTLEYADRDGNSILLDSEKGQIGLDGTAFKPPIPPTAETTIFRLSAYDNSPKPDVQEKTVTVKQPRAEITKFTADPMLVDVSKKATIKLTWATTNAQKITLDTPEGVKDVTRAEQPYPYDLQTTTKLTLNAYSYGTQFPAPTTQRVQVYAYKPGDPLQISFSGVAMQNWPIVLVNNVERSVYVQNTNNTISTFDVLTGKPKNGYIGSVMALSRDDSKLFAFNNDVNKYGVTIIDARTNAVSAPVGVGPVYLMIPTPDLKWLFCASTRNVSTVTRLSVDAGANKLSNPVTTNVGKTPRALIFNEGPTKLYVANYDSQSVSVITLQNNSVKTIQLNTTEPNSFAFNKEKNKLYVACEGSNKVEVIDTQSDTLAKAPITVGRRPSQLLISPSLQYVYVANFGDKTVSVIDTNTDTVKTTLTVGDGPIAMVLNGDANVFFVANYCSRSLSVVDVNNNVVLPQALPTGDTNGNPYGIAAFIDSNEYTKVFVAKENFPPRRTCSVPNNTSINVTVYSVQKPSR